MPRPAYVRWAREYDVCVGCGRDDSPHGGKGICRRCRDNSPERKKARRDNARATARVRREKERGGPAPTWSRSHYACLGCGTSERPHAAYGLCHRCYDATPIRKARQVAKEARRVKNRTAEDRARLNAQARARYARKAEKPQPPTFPRVGALVIILPTGETGQIVGHVPSLDEWTVRVPGEPDLPWEREDLIPTCDPLRRAA